MNATILPNGDLLLAANNAVRTEIAAMQASNRDYWGILADLFEGYSTNGRFTPFDASDGNPFVGLTSAPCVAEAMNWEDDGTQTIEGRLWCFPNYMLRDPLDELKRKGRTVFSLAGKP